MNHKLAASPFSPRFHPVQSLKALMLYTCSFFALIFVNTLCLGQDSNSQVGKDYPGPARFEKAIRRFEDTDTKQPPPQGAIVCVGSSSMSGWHGTIQNDLAPLTVIPRGFGGSNMNDLLHYADRIVLRHKPRAVVVYEGDNDIALGISPETVAAKFGEFVAKVRGRLPECRIYFISIKPSIARWPLWPKMKETNSLIALQCASDKRLTFVDVASGMLNEQGEPRKSLFKNDNLHMTRDGYVIWRDALKPILLKSELEHEELDVRNGDAASFRVRNGDGSETGTQLVFSTLVYSPTVWRYRLRPEGPRRGKTGRKRPQ